MELQELIELAKTVNDARKVVLSISVVTVEPLVNMTHTEFDRLFPERYLDRETVEKRYGRRYRTKEIVMDGVRFITGEYLDG